MNAIQKTCAFLQISIKEYEAQQSKAGMEYLTHYTDGDTDAIYRTIQRDEYWLWWANQFALANLRFCYAYRTNVQDATTTKWLRKEWVNFHKPSEVLVYPSPSLFTIKTERVKA